MTPDLDDDRRAKRRRPRQWQRLDRQLRTEAAVQAHREERRRRRPPLEPVVCGICGEPLGEVRAGESIWCRRCRTWSGGAAREAMG